MPGSSFTPTPLGHEDNLEVRHHPRANALDSYLTKIDRFGGKGILVCGGMLSSRTPLYVFNMGTVNLQRYRNEILEACVRFSWVLWAQATFLWMTMRGETELILLMNLMKERIYTVWIDFLHIRITIH
ncbi:hypothetical protein TNCV_3379891 [Trichonephila clavipes]|nr:hypothetical protein TNCV_3379891 [Trichonephila clavipes]